ncbi:MaoC family dehydratase [Rathayibacter soli]|uniref:MaoC family dehydratase n=1 Tax=Rathayibacter soli TaxID=3144168 RepID=UPI0027E4F095|nr:MaoC family dehydratase [Glaciibacter superstes]
MTARDLLGSIGEILGEGTIEITQAMVNEFAHATDDEQWIHVDQERARTGPFGATIAHGYLTLSLVPAMLSQAFTVENAAAILNYGVDRVRFPAPVPVGSTIHADVRLTEASIVDGGVQANLLVTMTGSSSSKPYCVANVVVRYLDECSTLNVSTVPSSECAPRHAGAGEPGPRDSR